MDTYISGVYHAITCKFQRHLCVPAWIELRLIDTVDKNTLTVSSLYTTTHTRSHVCMKNVEKHLTPELANYALLILILFFLLQHQGLVFLFICTHFKSNVSNTSIHCSEHGSKFHRSAINLLQVQLFSFFSFHIQRPFKYGHDVLCYF